ncbi:MAG TPA: DUF1559 domain-containing protein [Armatimonadota bacterium]|jgi:prepilin-type processing-associated H-X9-DG protein/prepilin-type N-terminal cleavage/methylation domain-containing protein
MRTRTGSGFTLIELLVVVAIVALLAALLFPVFVSARESARTATCQSNLHQIGHAIHLYADAWDDYLPEGATETNYLGAPMAFLRPYVGRANEGIWLCPSDALVQYRPDIGGGISEGFGVTRPFLPFRYDTSYKFVISRLMDDSFRLDPRTLSSVKSPSDTLMMAEGWPIPPTGGYAVFLEHMVQGHWPRFLMTGTTHRGRANYLFADGHVRTLGLRQTLVPKVLWERLSDWCPGCSGQPGSDWTSSDVQRDLAAMERYGQP